MITGYTLRLTSILLLELKDGNRSRLAFDKYGVYPVSCHGYSSVGIAFHYYFTVQNGLFRDGSTECYLARLLISLEAFFTSGDFILYCFDSVQLAIAREIFDFEGDVGLFIPEVVRSPLPDSK